MAKHHVKRAEHANSADCWPVEHVFELRDYQCKPLLTEHLREGNFICQLNYSTRKAPLYIQERDLENPTQAEIKHICRRAELDPRTRTRNPREISDPVERFCLPAGARKRKITRMNAMISSSRATICSESADELCTSLNDGDLLGAHVTIPAEPLAHVAKAATSEGPRGPDVGGTPAHVPGQASSTGTIADGELADAVRSFTVGDRAC